MLLVTHDIDEAIYMSDRIVILTPRPGRVERNIDVTLERPRERNSPEFLALRSEILEHLHLAGQSSETMVPGLNFPSGGSKPIEAASHRLEQSASKTAPLNAEQKLDTTVIIIGAGPAGSTLGAYLGQAGIEH